MSNLQEPLPVVVERVAPALEIVIQALRDSLPLVMSYQVEHGFDPARDPSAVNHQVRQFIRRRLEAAFPYLAEETANMSPVYVRMGQYYLKVNHARNGQLPPAKTDARKAYYAINDHPNGVLPVATLGFDDAEEAAEPEGEMMVENALVLIWDSEGGELTQVTLCRPSRVNPPGERLDLVTRAVVEDDIDIRQTDAGEESQEGDGS